MGKLTFNGKKFYFYGDSKIEDFRAHQRGFILQAERSLQLKSCWQTRSPFKAVMLRQYADRECEAKFKKLFITNLTAPEQIIYPDNLEPKLFQLESAWHCLTRTPSYVADEAGCIDGGAIVSVNRGGCARKMTLGELYRKFHGGKSGKNGCKVWQKNIPTMMSSVNEEGVLTLNQVEDVIYKGVKETLLINLKRGTKKYQISCTPDHEILTPAGWVAASHLTVGSVAKTNGLKFCDRCKTHTEHAEYKYSKNLDKCKNCIQSDNGGPIKARPGKDGYLFIYKGMRFHPNRSHPKKNHGSVALSVLSYEANRNGVSLPLWIEKIKFNSFLPGCFFVPKGMDIHHLDEDKTNNEPDNLVMLTRAEHARLHPRLHHIKHMVVTNAVVTGIKSNGLREVYDVVMADPHRNFIANGVVVHNCGKTITAILCMNSFPGRVLVICPPYLKYNWEKEIIKWIDSVQSVCSLTIIPHSDVAPGFYDESRIVIVPDSLIANPKVKENLMRQKFIWLFVDEIHRFKEEKAQRTIALLGDDKHEGITSISERTVLLSGTPIPNGRPIELYPVLSSLAPESIGHRPLLEYGKTFCGGKQVGRLERGKTIFNWDFSGATRLKQLKAELREKFMVRHLKKTVMPELPAKTRQIIFLDTPKEILKFETQRLKGYTLKDLLGEKAELGDIATYRKEVGEAKIKQAIEIITDFLDNNPKEKLVVFAHHIGVVDQLEFELDKYWPLKIRGGMKPSLKDERVRLFQTKKKYRLIVGNMESMGLGLTLTAAQNAIVVEPSWCPGVNEQAEDRLHRITQGGNVYIKYLVLRGSLDERMLKTVLWKERNINKAMN